MRSHPNLLRLHTLILTLCLMLALCGVSQAQLTTTNSVNGSVTSGAPNVTYSWTIEQDLDATLKIVTASSLASRVHYYDPAGNELGSFDSGYGGTVTSTVVHLGPGAYSVRVEDLGGSGSFTLSCTRAIPAQTNDLEPNNDAAHAIAITSSTTNKNGHLGYSYSDAYSHVDSNDYYSFQPSDDGVATVSVAAVSTLAIRLHLYDGAGNELGSNDSGYGGTATYALAHAGKGQTYYARLEDLGGYGGYLVSTSVTPCPKTADLEPNDDLNHAITIAQNATNVNGRLGYSYATYGSVDSNDCYKVVASANGTLSVSAKTDTTLAIRLHLYDGAGNELGSNDSGYGGTATYALAHAGKGQTYYARLEDLGGYGGYLLSNTYTAPSINPDLEPNDDTAHALSLTFNTTNVNGQLGYSRATYGNVDTDDYYVVSPTDDGSFSVSAKTDATLAIRLHLYDGAGNEIGSNDSGYNGTATYALVHAGKGQTYYARLELLGGYGGYLLSNSLAVPARKSDAEPNNTYDKAAAMLTHTVNSEGRLGYSYATYGSVDSNDWYTFVATADGDETITAKTDATLALRVHFYDASLNEVVSFDSGYNGTASGTIAHLGNGQRYYVRLELLGGYGTYLLNSNITSTSRGYDPEPNDDANHAYLLTLTGTSEGHLGYSRATYGNVDGDDWYYFVAPSDGNLNLSITADATLNARVHYYDAAGNEVLSSDTGYGATTAPQFSHLGGGQTYFVRVQLLGGYGGYGIVTSYRSETVNNDIEPNDSFATAQVVSTLNALSGHLGFSRGGTYGNVDPDDFFKVPASSTLKLQSSVKLNARLHLYDINGNELLSSDTGYNAATTVNVPANTAYVRVQLLGGYGYYVFNATPLGSISGTISFDSVPANHAPIPVKVTLHPQDNSGDLVYTINSGNYVQGNLPRKIYDVTFLGDRWLRRIYRGIDLTYATTITINPFLLAGDTNGDNVVNVDDLTNLLYEFNTAKGDGSYEMMPTADLNVDGFINVDDLTLLLNNFNLTGDF